MKNLMMLICSVVLFAGTHPSSAAIPENPSSGEKEVKILCSPDLYDVLDDCLAAYRQEGGSTPASLTILGEQDINAWIAARGQLALVTKYHLGDVDPQQSRMFVVGREVYVPVMHCNNPYREEIMQRGISPREFTTLYCVEKDVSWDDVLQNGNKHKVNAYRTSDPSFTAYLADFTEADPEMIRGAVLPDCDMVLAAVSKDVHGIGFCTLSQLRKMHDSGDPVAVAMIPVDMNGNNKMDHFEEIYGSVSDLSRGIWIGKFAGSLYSRIFAVSSQGMVGSSEREFLGWMAGPGQEILAANGYSALLDNEQASLMASLEQVPAVVAQEEVTEKWAYAGLVIVAIVIGLGLINYLVFKVFNDKRRTPEELYEAAGTNFVAASSEVPGGYYFDRSHTWTFQEKDGNIRVGVDNFIQKLTGPVTRVEMKLPGESIRKGKTLFTLVQHGKRMEMKSPVSGKIVSHNEKLNSKSSLINTAPFSEGWIYMIEPSNWAEEFSLYLGAPKYREWIKSEFARLKDFLTNISKPGTNTVVVLQDGGDIRDGVLKDLGPEVWEDFQSDFLRN
ncbi:MAG: hypothetical protein P1P82_03380 [Bacteroidales bacterium]|nr:hypothetical protein [Bacteroidales bacterium]MDT8431993.1 hypothetical protein [Bacteroidales bacterium]